MPKKSANSTAESRESKVEVSRSPQFQQIYANSVSVDNGGYDLRITFGHSGTDAQGMQTNEEQASVTMTHDFALDLIRVLIPLCAEHAELDLNSAEDDLEWVRALVNALPRMD